MRKFLFFILLGLVVIAQAQENQQLILGKTLKIHLSADAPVQLLYTADEAQTITVSAQAIESDNSPDVVLWIVDNDNHLLAYNDNFGDSSNPRIENLSVDKGDYYIYVDSFNGVSEGDVDVLVKNGNRFNEQIVSTETGVEIYATLPEAALYRYQIELKAEEVLTLTAKDMSGTLDPYLRILDERGNAVAVNDDHSGEDTSLDIFDARITNWTVPEHALYTIELRDFLGRSGEFELKIEGLSG